jgi:tetratricopeptide (TPR) repeat protein
LPDSIDALVTTQIDRLPPGHRRLLRYAAVLGRSFSLRDLDALISGELARPDAATWAELADFVELEGAARARFRHALIRDTAYQELSFRRRRELHGRAARMLEQDLGDRAETEAELLSLHFFSARAYPDAWRYACVAGRRACDKYANVDAAPLLERAIAAARRLPELTSTAVAEVWELLGDVRERSGVYDGAVAAYRAARRLVQDDPVHEAGLLLKEAWIPERTGRYAEAVRRIRKGLGVLEGIGGEQAARRRAQLTAWFGSVRQAQGRSTEAVEWCRAAIEEATAVGDREAEAHASLVLDWAYVRLGRRELATHSARALELYEELGDLSGQAGVLNNLGAFAYWRGDWDEAVRYYERAGQLELRSGDAVNAAIASANVGEVLADQGRLDAAAVRLGEALRVFRASQYGYMLGFALTVLGRVAARRGDLDTAAGYLDEARREFVAAELHSDVVHADALRAEALVLAGDAAGALALVEATLTAGRAEDTDVDVPLLERVRGYALAQQGDADQAVVALHAGLESARAQQAEYELALTLDALGRVTGDAGARAHAAGLFARLGVEWIPEVPLSTPRPMTPA